MYCIYCGAELREGARFCVKCGKKQPDDEVSAPAAPIENDEPSPKPTEEGSEVPVTEAQAANSPETGNEDTAQTPPTAELTESVTEENIPEAETVEEADTVEAAASVIAAEETPSAQKVKKGHPILSILLCILLFVTALTAVMIGLTRAALSPDSIGQAVEKIELNDLDLRDVKTGRAVELSEYILALCDEKIIEKYDLTQESIETLIEKLEWKEFVTDTLTDFSGVFLNGESLSLDSDDIVDFIKDNEDLLTDSLNGFKFDYDKLQTLIDENIMPVLDLSGIQKAIGFNIAVITYGLSLAALVVSIVLAGVWVLLILLANRFRWGEALGYVGKTAIILGALLLLGSGTGLALSLVLGIELLEALLVSPMITAVIVSASILVGGILMAVVSAVIKAVSAKKAK